MMRQEAGDVCDKYFIPDLAVTRSIMYAISEMKDLWLHCRLAPERGVLFVMHRRRVRRRYLHTHTMVVCFDWRYLGRFLSLLLAFLGGFMVNSMKSWDSFATVALVLGFSILNASQGIVPDSIPSLSRQA